jgi:thymidylate kinase
MFLHEDKTSRDVKHLLRTDTVITADEGSPLGSRLRTFDLPASIPNLCVLLGPDYAGKTAALSALGKKIEGRFVSYDDAFLGSYASLIGTLKTEFITRYHIATAHADAHSTSHDFLMSLLHPIILLLRDQALSDPTAPIVLIDGYYYKILAKCLLHGLVNERIFSWWRSFPQPRHIIYLDADPEVTWERSAGGRRLNPSEYYGRAATYESFKNFQNDLRKTLLREVDHLPVSIVQGCGESSQTLSQLEHIVERFCNDR